MNTNAAREIVARYGLQPHPEGGWFREIYRSAERVAAPQGERSALTLIHFMLAAGEFSALHRLRSDESWHFISGVEIAVETIAPGGERSTLVLGPNARSETVVPAGTLFGAHVAEDAPEPGYALVSCCVAPGFDFADFEMPSRHELVAAHPAHAALIARLTRPAAGPPR